jgi:hypothetical protein
VGLFRVGLSTIHDAFYRYPAEFFQTLYRKLVLFLPPQIIEEFRELGRFVLVDGSTFPIAISEIWAQFRKNSRALKLHLAFSLEQMIATCFLITDAKSDERKQFAKILEKSITYIADKGYLSFDLFNTIASLEAFFIIRVRKRLHFQIIENFQPSLPAKFKYVFFQLTDQLVRFDSDPYQRIYRRISFRTSKTIFIIITNRLDLISFDVIRLYGFRWQIELFFRFFKRTLHAIHLLNHSINGITIQFYVVLITHALLLHYKQSQLQQCLFDIQQDNRNTISICNGQDFVKALNNQIPLSCKLSKQELNRVKNLLLKGVQLSFDFGWLKSCRTLLFLQRNLYFILPSNEERKADLCITKLSFLFSF